MAKAKRIIVKQVFIAADNICTPLGDTAEANFSAVKIGASAVKQHSNTQLLPQPFYAALFDNIPTDNKHTRFEQLCIRSIENALGKTSVKLDNADTLFILSTTKGNIELIENGNEDEHLRKQVELDVTAQTIAAHFGAANKPLVVSNACISGVLAIIIAMRLIVGGKYKHIVVTGVDVLSQFILSGFSALGAMSAEPCKPFDAARTGINLGECAATVVLTADETLYQLGMPIVLGGASTNDANHISGPSRTGEELATAIQQSMQQSGVDAAQLSFVSAHGTATVFNDEMEAKAFKNAGLENIPVHSLKPHFGHTLGAAGVLESIITYRSLQARLVLPSLNYDSLGVSEQINVSPRLTLSNKKYALKTASGFGGCNAAVVFGV